MTCASIGRRNSPALSCADTGEGFAEGVGDGQGARRPERAECVSARQPGGAQGAHGGRRRQGGRRTQAAGCRAGRPPRSGSNGTISSSRACCLLDPRRTQVTGPWWLLSRDALELFGAGVAQTFVPCKVEHRKAYRVQVRDLMMFIEGTAAGQGGGAGDGPGARLCGRRGHSGAGNPAIPATHRAKAIAASWGPLSIEIQSFPLQLVCSQLQGVMYTI